MLEDPRFTDIEASLEDAPVPDDEEDDGIPPDRDDFDDEE